jgi:hypothetical protein
MMIENSGPVLWTENDYRQGWCRHDQIGQKLDTAPIDDPVIKLAMEGERGYRREAAAYHADPDTYKARNPPGVVKAVLDWIEMDDARQAAKSVSLLDKTLDQIVDEDHDRILDLAVLAAVADDDEARASKVIEAMGMAPEAVYGLLCRASDRLGESHRVELGKRCFNPVPR